MIIEKVPVDIRESFKRACMRNEMTMREALIDYMRECGRSGSVFPLERLVDHENQIEELKASFQSINERIQEAEKIAQEIEKKAGDPHDPTARGEA